MTIPLKAIASPSPRSLTYPRLHMLLPGLAVHHSILNGPELVPGSWEEHLGV